MKIWSVFVAFLENFNFNARDAMPTKGCGLITVAAAANFTAAAKEIKEGDNVLLKTPAPAS